MSEEAMKLNSELSDRLMACQAMAVAFELAAQESDGNRKTQLDVWGMMTQFKLSIKDIVTAHDNLQEVMGV